MIDLDEITMNVDRMIMMRDMLVSIGRKAGQRDDVDVVELSRRCLALVEEALRGKAN